MIVFPMLGRSSRFFKAGYNIPKYQLPLWGETVFSHCVRSFELYFSTDAFVFLVRNDFNAREFVALEAARLGILDFRIIQIDFETRGQAESVYLGVKDVSDDQELIVFNIDTIRLDFVKPTPGDFGDGFLEVFEAEGDAWSFVDPVTGSNRVARTTEKERISSLCSDGLYGFKRVGDFKAVYHGYDASGETVNGEIYIAPLYNQMIKMGNDIRYSQVDASVILHCGVPQDYEDLLKKPILSKL
jgi:dTDP-glucose pyrophosphorylase